METLGLVTIMLVFLCNEIFGLKLKVYIFLKEKNVLLVQILLRYLKIEFFKVLLKTKWYNYT